ncbi:hypothetical protein ACFWU3_26355 [Streptomyces sp. NPDC058685]|uniref:hypothetical protein n=1 Tax=Streptomyces sp. NPDC058685 TaxID=3346598 RepID=UPI0036562534
MRFRITVESDDTDAPEEIVALCTDATGYYIDPPPPARHRYELRGCSPAGGLARAVAAALDNGSAPLGGLTLRALDRHGEPVEPAWDVWCLTDVRILGAGSAGARGTPVDITIEAVMGGHGAGDGYDEQPEVPEVPPLFSGFALMDRDDEDWGVCRQVALIDKEPEPDVVPLRLLGCELRGPLSAAWESGEDRFELGGVYLASLDRSGVVIDEHWTCLHVDSWVPSPAGTGRVDLTLDVSCDDFRSSAAGTVHEMWWEGPPREPHLWSALSGSERVAWSNATQNNRTARPAPGAPVRATIHLDGRHITDVQGFALALGEAVNGPGGWFGACLGTIDHALGGDWGARPPFTLVWHDHEVARACLGRTPLTYDASPSFAEILAFFAARKVDVVLA